tara:strand:+ start:23 stop:388 length:366 start_codon:yes stop_codon:yes gene_type:complete
MDNSLLSLMENSENTININTDDNTLLNFVVGIGLNILLFISYNNIYINLLIYILLYTIIGNYLIENKKILTKEINGILLFILFCTSVYDLLNVFEYNKRSPSFVLLNINLMCIKTLVLYNI